MNEPLSIRSIILDDPDVSKELHLHAKNVIQDIDGPFPVTSDGRIGKALTQASWRRIAAQLNAGFPSGSETPDNWNDPIPQIPYDPPELVALLKDRVKKVATRLSSGELRAKAIAMNGQPTDIPASMWDNPEVAIDLAGNLYLLDKQKLRRTMTGIMLQPMKLEVSVSRGGGFDDDGLVEATIRRMSSDKLQSPLEAARRVCTDDDIPGRGSRDSRVKRIAEKVRKRIGRQK